MDGFKILLYHSVGEVAANDNLGIRIDRDTFRSQMKWLKEENHNVWMLKDAVDCIIKKRVIPQKTVAITFDDGYKDNILNAAPIMENLGFRATFFITVDYIGKVKKSNKRPWQHWDCMDWNDLGQLLKRGHDIGSHSLHHIDLRTLKAAEKEFELKSSKDKLGSSLNRVIDLFSYPYGYFDDVLLEIARCAGYKAACTTTDGLNGLSADLYRLNRTEIENRERLDERI